MPGETKKNQPNNQTKGNPDLPFYMLFIVAFHSVWLVKKNPNNLQDQLFIFLS